VSVAWSIARPEQIDPQPKSIVFIKKNYGENEMSTRRRSATLLLPAGHALHVGQLARTPDRLEKGKIVTHRTMPQKKAAQECPP
jgi:hypothetical protein